MAATTASPGNALMALNTNRPPNLARKLRDEEENERPVVHLNLTLPIAVIQLLDAWWLGERGPVSYIEARKHLWSSEVASHLKGRPDDWLDVPGILQLLAVWRELESRDQGEWPHSQADLAKLFDEVAGTEDGQPLSDFPLATTVGFLNDLVLIFKYAAIRQPRPLRLAASLYRLACTLQATTQGPASQDEVRDWLSAPLVVPNVFTSPIPPSGPKPPADAPAFEPNTLPIGPAVSPISLPEDTVRRFQDDVIELERARDAMHTIDALRNSGIDDSSLIRRITDIATANLPEMVNSEADPSAAISARYDALSARVRPATQPTRIVRTRIAGTPVSLNLTAAAARTVSMRRAFSDRLSASLPEDLRNRLSRLGLPLEETALWAELMAPMYWLERFTTPEPSFLEPVGRSDLLLVRQITTGYRPAEISHIENVLEGETRRREHTFRALSREEFFTSIETETEEIKDLQVTDRAELNREVGKVVSEDLRAQGSVEVTSRGPSKVVARAEGSFGRSTEEAAKTVEQYARETVQRAVERTMERVRRETRSILEQETRESNVHAFTRADDAASHMSGVYQFLERVSHAKVFCYGERELYDILVPEPAALIWELAASQPDLHITVQKPDVDLFNSLTLDNIEEKRDDIIQAFRVVDMPAIPAEWKDIDVGFAATGSGDGAKYASNKEIQIPEGYKAIQENIRITVENEGGDDPEGGVIFSYWGEPWMVDIPDDGSHADDWLANWTIVSEGPTVAVGFHADNFTSLTANVHILLQRTHKGYNDWALDAYGRVAEKFEQLRREYEEALVEITMFQPPDVLSLPEGSRLRLQQIMRFELQRAAIEIMSNRPVDFHLIRDYVYAGTATHPTADLSALKKYEPEIRFLQQAFEWEHLSWILYPYFWGSRAEWADTVVQSHPDPDFEAFLNAGAARLQIAVRPGFEELVKHFMETGEVYEGDGLPKMGEPGYIPFIDEQLTTLGAPGEEVPWPTEEAPLEWDIVAPTSLVIVRRKDEIDQLPCWDHEGKPQACPE